MQYQQLVFQKIIILMKKVRSKRNGKISSYTRYLYDKNIIRSALQVIGEQIVKLLFFHFLLLIVSLLSPSIACYLLSLWLLLLLSYVYLWKGNLILEKNEIESNERMSERMTRWLMHFMVSMLAVFVPSRSFHYFLKYFFVQNKNWQFLSNIQHHYR